jgi:transposase
MMCAGAALIVISARSRSVPGIGPIISSAIVAAIGAGDVFTKGRDFAAWLGLFLSRYRPGTVPFSARYPGVAIATCGFYSCRRRGSC